MKFNKHQFSLLYAFDALVLAMIIGATFKGCDSPELIPVSEHRTPVEDNFHHEKLWTADDFKQAEIAPEDVNYYNQCQTACPDDLTADDLAQIEAHHQAQMKKLTAGVKNENGNQN